MPKKVVRGGRAVNKGKKLTVSLHIGDKEVETLTPEQRELIAQRIGEVTSRYYTANPEEYRLLKKGN